MIPKVSAFFDEFPFLRNLLTEEKVNSVSVSRWDESFLQRSLRYYHSEGSYHVGDIYLLSKAGELIIQVGKFPPPSFNLFDWRTWFSDGSKDELVEKALDRIGPRVYKVYYAVLDRKSKLVVYKPPHGFENIGDWLNDEKKIVQQELSRSRIMG